MTTLVDPTAEMEAVNRTRPERPASLNGLKVGLLDISKARGNVFLDRLDQRLSGAEVIVGEPPQSVADRADFELAEGAVRSVDE